MTIGLSSYAYFWRMSDRVPDPLSLDDALRDTHELGVELFQICDHAPIEGYDDAALERLRSLAAELGIRLELGTRGLGTAHLTRYLEIAQALGVTLVRTMVNSAEHRPTVAEAEGLLRDILPAASAAGVTLALETYEQVSSESLVGLVERIGSPGLGICLDPANSVAALENPREVIERTAPHVVNIHVKDFAFTRQDGWVGFTLAGCPLGEGQLDYGFLERTVRPESRGINRIIEHWLPWQGDPAETCRVEDRWTRHNLTTLRSF